MKITKKTKRVDVVEAYVLLLDVYKKLLMHCADQADQLHRSELDNARLRNVLK